MFRPSLHGWPFRNGYTCAISELGASGPLPQLGLGGGMCWAALDRYLRGVAIHREVSPPEPGSALHTELRQRQVAALAGVWPRIRDWQERPEGSWRDRFPLPIPFTGQDLASRTRAEWGTLRRRLDTGEPVLLTLLPGGGGYDRPRAVRQVLATGGTRSGSRVTLTLYDPDFPNDDDIRLAFSLAGELDARLSGGNELRGFFAVPYDREVRPTLRVEAFDDRSVIGLRREVRGTPSAAAGRRYIALLARNPRGGLLHFERRDGHWEGVNVTGAEDFGAHELHSDPVGFHRAGMLHVFARSYTGDLLHFRRLRSWSLTNRTEHKRAGARFRIGGRPVPVPGPRFGISVLGRDADGGLVHYHAAPLRGWTAEQVPGDPVADDPVADRTEDTLHVVGVASDGRVLHWARRDVWTMTDTDAGPGPRVRLAGRPVMHLTPERVSVFGRDQDHALVVLELGADGVWHRRILASGLAADPAVTTGPSGLHTFAPTIHGGLLHGWRRDGEWAVEDVVESRPTLEPGPDGDASVAAWGDDRTLRVFVRRGSRLRAYGWSADADWVADPLTDRAGTRPSVFRDHYGRPHVVVTDGRGILVHVETGEWREPGRSTERTPVATVPTIERAEPDSKPEPHRSQPGDSGDDAMDPPPLLDEPDADAHDAPETAEPHVYDFEIERLHPEPALEDEASPSSSSEPAPSADRGSRREFRWEDRPPPTSPDQIEPMDLSALDSWPPTRSARERKEERERENGADREAS